MLGYTSRGHVCGFYGNAILFESKARKQAQSELCNCFSNAAIGQKSASENRKCGRAKYNYRHPQPTLYSLSMLLIVLNEHSLFTVRTFLRFCFVRLIIQACVFGFKAQRFFCSR
jgi:hypothetical protein